jgi:hypothetical protein
MSDDFQWRRPSGADADPTRFPGAGADPARSPGVGAGQAPSGGQPAYSGPPRSTPPPPDWHPRTLIQAPPPRQLPAQDTQRLDAEERETRTVTYGVGMIAGAVLLIVLFVLCGRALF